MTFLPHPARHLARHWRIYLLFSMAAGLLVADLQGLLFGPRATGRVSASGLAPLLVPALLVCAALWAVGTKLDRARRELEGLRAELDRAQTLGRTGAWSYADGRFHWSLRAQNILGAEEADMLTFDRLVEHVAPEDRAQLERALSTARAGGHYRAEFCVAGSGSQRRVLLEGQPDAACGIGDLRLEGIVQDMSERYRMEREVRRAMRYQRALLDNFPFMVWLKDRDLRFLAVNRPMARAGGLHDPDQACGLRDHDLWSAGQADEYLADDLEVLRNRALRCSESVVVSGKRSTPYEIWKAPVLDDGGELLGIVGFARDISDRKRSEEALQRSRDQLATLGRLQARFIRGESGEALFSSMLDILLDLSGCSDGFVAEVARDVRRQPYVNLLACCTTDWLRDRADLIDVALRVDGSDCESGHVVVAAADDGAAGGLTCIAVMSERRLVGLIGLATPDGRIADDRLDGVQAAVGTFGLILQAGVRERARRHAEHELKRHRDRLTDLVEEQLADSIEARRMAKEANRAKSRFLANVSHELRTPLHAILGFSRLALRDREPLSDTTRRRFEIIRESGERLLAHVDELLDLSNLEAGTIQLEKAVCNISELTMDTVEDHEVTVTGRGVHVRVAGPVTPVVIEVDAYRVSLVLRRLLGNATRFSPPGGEVVVSLGRHPHEGIDGALISVSDLGPGIAEHELESIFDPLEQASRSGRAEGDAGLGLAICREIVELHGGWIRASNPDGRGACIEIWLPTGEVPGQAGYGTAGDALPDRPAAQLPRAGAIH